MTIVAIVTGAMAVTVAACVSIAPTSPPSASGSAAIGPTTERTEVTQPTFAGNAPSNVWGIIFNTRPGHPFADATVRQAFALCLDVPGLADRTTDGVPILRTTTILPADSPWHIDGVGPPGQNADQAIALIEGAGWVLGPDGVYTQDGRRLGGTMIAQQGPPLHAAFLRSAADSLRTCGFGFVESGAGTLEGPLEDAASYELIAGAWHSDDVRRAFGSEAGTGEVRYASSNPGAWSDAETDRLLTAIDEAPDDTARAAAYATLQRHLANELPVIPLWSYPAVAP
jgi:peptide/nickel transport system substrate-binding protein